MYPVILAGLSLGGGISLKLTLKYTQLIKLLILVGAWELFQKLPYHRLTYWYTRSKLNENIYEWTGKYSSFIRWALEYSLFGDETEISSE